MEELVGNRRPSRLGWGWEGWDEEEEEEGTEEGWEVVVLGWGTEEELIFREIGWEICLLGESSLLLPTRSFVVSFR